MTHKHNGGPAFPYPSPRSEKQIHGMSLRDYFAAQAMQGIVTHEDMWTRPDSAIAESAYGLADAMIKAREK